MRKMFCLALASMMLLASVHTVMAEEAEGETEGEFQMPTIDELEAMTDEEQKAFFAELEAAGISFGWDESIPEVQEGVKHIACIGDSITYGAGITDKYTQAWPALLDGLISDDYQVINYGLSGRTLLNEGDEPYTAEEYYTISKDLDADVYIIMLGTNDSKPYNWNADNYRSELIKFAETYSNLEGNPTVYLMIPSRCFVVEGNDAINFDISNDVISQEIMPIINEVAAEYGYPVIDLYAFTQDHPEWFDDGVHPNVEGNVAIAEYIASQLVLE